jgi:hypothetical protein
MAYNSKNYQTTEDTLVLNEPAVLRQESREKYLDQKLPGLLGELLELANKQIEEGDTITHEEFLLQRKLRRGY